MTEPHATFPNKFEAFYLVAVLIAIQFVLTLVLRETTLLDTLDWEGASALVTVVGNGIVFIVLLTIKKMSYGALFHPSSQSVLSTVSTILMPVAIMVPGLVMLTGGLNLIVHWLLPMSQDDVELWNSMLAFSPIPIFSACIAAPLLEEMLFRGLILRSFLTQYSRTTAILWSSLIFALAHLNAYQFFTAFILGIVSGWLYERTRSLWPSVLLHAFFNTFVVFSVNAMPNESVLGLGLAFTGTIVGGLVLLRMLEPASSPRLEDRS